MITQETARDIYNCYASIKEGFKLLGQLQTKLNDQKESLYIDTFGTPRHITMAVPSGQDSRSIYRVPPKLGIEIIEANIERHQEELKALMAKAGKELKGGDHA